MADAPPTAPPAGGGNIISAAVAAALIKVTEQRLGQLVRAGHIKKTARGEYHLLAVVHGYIDFLKDEERRSSKSASASRVQDARADEIAMRMEERSKRLVHEARREAVAVVDSLAGGLRTDLMSVPARVTRDLPLRRKLEDEIDNAFGAAAKRAQRALDHSGAAAPALGAPSKANAGRVGARKPRLSAKRRRSRPA